MSETTKNTTKTNYDRPRAGSFRDNKAPEYLKVTIADPKGNTIAELSVDEKVFSTGSVGYYLSEKLSNPENRKANYQTSFTMTLIGSKEEPLDKKLRSKS